MGKKLHFRNLLTVFTIFIIIVNVYSMPEQFRPRITFAPEDLYGKLSPIQYFYTQNEAIEQKKITEMYKIFDEGKYHCRVCDE